MLTIGHIDYMNTLPVFFYFDPDALWPGAPLAVRIVRSTPAELNRLMREGQVDIGPMSSFAYGLDPDRYVLLPSLSVSAYGPVGSIFLFAHRPLHTYRAPHVALTNRSATSVHLAKIILETFMHLQPTYETVEPNLPAMLASADVALMIGDEAIVAHRNGRRYYAYDLGELWRTYTGAWMTFAVWGVRREAVAAHEELVWAVHRAFIHSKWRTRHDPRPLVEAAKARLGGTDAEWYRYFEGLSHELDHPQREGLKRYFAYAAEHRFLPQMPEIEILEPPVTVGLAVGAER